MALLNDLPNKFFITENFNTFFNVWQDTFDITYRQINENFDDAY